MFFMLKPTPSKGKGRIKTRVLALSQLFVFAIIFSGFQNNVSKLQSRIIDLQAEYLSKLQKLNEDAEAFKAGSLAQDSLMSSLSISRKAYKKLEFIYAYRYPEFCEKHINGAPLLQISRHSTLPFVVPPQGLQVLDELVQGKIDAETAAEIALQTQELYSKAKVLAKGLENDDPLSSQELVEAMRLQLMRIYSLGLTGFDTPGSLNVEAEAKASLRSMQQIHSLLDLASLEHDFTLAIQYLDRGIGFENLDRANYLKKYLDPLYRKLGAQQKDLGGAAGHSGAWNWHSESLMAADLLDPYFFTELKREEDSPVLRSLGKQLFYDPILSANQQMSCASCHNPKLAFSDGKAKSVSQQGSETIQRNAPGLLNAVYADRYFYDLRAFSLEQQAEHVIFNPKEFNTAYDQILEKLKKNEDYRAKFKSAFGDEELNTKRFSQALASYVLSLQSFNSPVDEYLRGERDTLDSEIINGFNLFMGKANCGTCHFSPTFSGLVPPLYQKNETEILGVKKHPGRLNKSLDADLGRIANGISSEQAWIYERSFKTTTVRNVEFTAPYFHNGAYGSLEQVLDFYNNGGGAGMGLEVKNQTLAADSLHLSNQEKKEILAFLRALSDTSSAYN